MLLAHYVTLMLQVRPAGAGGGDFRHHQCTALRADAFAVHHTDQLQVSGAELWQPCVHNDAE